MDSGFEILKKIEAAMQYLSKESCRHLPQVRDFETSISGLLDQLRKQMPSLEKVDGSEGVITSLANLFKGFDACALDVKKEIVQRGLAVIGRMSREAFSSPDHVGDDGYESPDHQLLQMRRNYDRLSQPVQYLKGVGPKIAALLGRKGLVTIEDMIYFFPRRYEDRRNIVSIRNAVIGKKETVVGDIVAADIKQYARRRVFELTVSDGNSILTAVWFKGSTVYLKKNLKQGQRIILSGDVRDYRYHKSMAHPDYEILDADDHDLFNFNRIIPVYSETEGLRQKTLRRIMLLVTEQFADAVSSDLPDDLKAKRKLAGMGKAIRDLHFPPHDSDIDKFNMGISDAHRRVVYDEFFFMQLGMALRKRGRTFDKGISFRLYGNLLKQFYQILPFELTEAQKRVIREIEKDMAASSTMNRLLQGDVGSGKTVVSMSAMITACENGFQNVIMAPTEILANQHYNNIRLWSESLGLKASLLTGGMNASERKTILAEVEKGEIDIVVGTHALIQESVNFHKLGLVVIDEQHRFGVMQRASLQAKGENPDILVMTATPIPRTLAMTVYGDLDVSVIDQLPPNKKHIATKVYYEQQRAKVYELVRNEIEKGHQAFIVYPLVEESETLDLKDATQMASHLQKDIFPQYKIGLIHGKMKARQKDEVMNAFLEKRNDVLVSTTVIEVGIDVPHASVMVIEHAERFGLSQLHQLRGRVGRSDIPSSCVLMAQHRGSEDARRRLKIMEQTNDGFRIAEEDLAIRGPGEFLGIRQSGIPDFRLASIVRDGRILNDAKEDAFAIVEKDPFLKKPEHQAMKEMLLKRWAGRLELAKVG